MGFSFCHAEAKAHFILIGKKEIQKNEREFKNTYGKCFVLRISKFILMPFAFLPEFYRTNDFLFPQS